MSDDVESPGPVSRTSGLVRLGEPVTKSRRYYCLKSFSVES